MSKSEMYLKAIELYKNTGQGLPYTIMSSKSDLIGAVDELIEDGLLKIVEISYSHLPNDKFACLTNVYCVEEDKDPSALTYMRMYVGLDKIIDIGNLHQLTLKDAIKDADFINKYSKWLKKNHKDLEKISELESVSVKESELSDEVIKFIKSRGWYEENLTIGECLSKSEDATQNNNKQIQIIKQLIDLMSSDRSKYKDKIKEHEDNLKELEIENKLRKSLESFLRSKNKRSKIQNIL